MGDLNTEEILAERQTTDINRKDPASEKAPLEAETTSDIPPEGGYGWVCVICVAIIFGNTWGINSSYGVFLSCYLTHDYFPNTSALFYAFIGGLSISQALMIAPFATRVVHYRGTKVCLHLGIFFETLSLIASSFCRLNWQIILAQGVCFGWGMGLLFVASVGIIPQWFVKRRSLANAFGVAGSGFGAVVWSLAAQRMIDILGIPWTFRILGLVCFAVNLVCANLLRDRNKKVGSVHKAFSAEIFCRPEFLFLAGWSFFSMLGYVAVVFSVASYAVSIGLSAQQGALANAMLNLGQGIGRPIIGLASDRYGRLNMAFWGSLAASICCFAFWIPVELASSKMGLLTFFAVVGGAFAGTFWCTVAVVAAEVVGLQDLPTALSMIWVVMVPPTTFAEAIALELRKKGRASWIYLGTQIFIAMTYLVAALCMLVVRGWKVAEREGLERKREIEFKSRKVKTFGEVADGHNEEAFQVLSQNANMQRW